jgi:hypothetical protein
LTGFGHRILGGSFDIFRKMRKCAVIQNSNADLITRATTTEPTPAFRCSDLMKDKQDLRAIERREYRIDEALKETFPASDVPSFVGAGAVNQTDDTAAKKLRNKSAEMAGETIDQNADPSASSEERASRKRRLLMGPKEFVDLRRDHPARRR